MCRHLLTFSLTISKRTPPLIPPLLQLKHHQPKQNALFPLPLTSPKCFSLCLSNSIKWLHHPPNCSVKSHTSPPPPPLIHHLLALPPESIRNAFTFPSSTAITLVLFSVLMTAIISKEVSLFLVLIVVLSPYSSQNNVTNVNQMASFLSLLSLHTLSCTSAPQAHKMLLFALSSTLLLQCSPAETFKPVHAI